MQRGCYAYSSSSLSRINRLYHDRRSLLRWPNKNRSTYMTLKLQKRKVTCMQSQQTPPMYHPYLFIYLQKVCFTDEQVSFQTCLPLFDGDIRGERILRWIKKVKYKKDPLQRCMIQLFLFPLNSPTTIFKHHSWLTKLTPFTTSSTAYFKYSGCSWLCYPMGRSKLQSQIPVG